MRFDRPHAAAADKDKQTLQIACQIKHGIRSTTQKIHLPTEEIWKSYDYINLLKPSSLCTTSSNIQKFLILLTQFNCTFCMYLATDREFHPMHHPMISFITEIASVYCSVRVGALNRTVYVSSFKINNSPYFKEY